MRARIAALTARAEKAEAERDTLKAKLEALEKPRYFPIMDGPAVLWTVMEPHEYRAKLNHAQSLEQLAARGGLSSAEAWCVVQNLHWKNSPPNAVELWHCWAIEQNERRDALKAENAELREKLAATRAGVIGKCRDCGFTTIDGKCLDGCD